MNGSGYQRLRQLIHEGASFGVVGAAGFVINLGAADVLRYDAGLGKYTALATATILAAVATYFGNRFWAFRHRTGTGSPRETGLFFALNGIGLLIQAACVWLADDLLGFTGRASYLAAVIVGTGLGTLFRFWSYRKWVWREPAGTDLPGRRTGPRHARPRGRARAAMTVPAGMPGQLSRAPLAAASDEA
ncbi:MAG: GtrA family protein [Streptosporangiaceae bacterium]